jgi:hypothetical protein
MKYGLTFEDKELRNFIFHGTDQQLGFRGICSLAKRTQIFPCELRHPASIAVQAGGAVRIGTSDYEARAY